MTRFFSKQPIGALSWVIALIATISYPAARAEVIYTITPTTSIRIEGTIGEDDPIHFAQAVEDLARRGLHPRLNTIELDSRGGNDGAAIAIGGIIRALGWNTYVGPDASCASACVDILIGGNQRFPFGAVGIHRGHWQAGVAEDGSRANQSIADSRINQSTYEEAMLESDLLFKASQSIEPWNIKWLSEDEKFSFGVALASPHYEDDFLSRISTKRGISSDELMAIVSSNQDDCLREVKEFHQTFFDCVSNRKIKYHRNLKTILKSWGRAVSDWLHNPPIRLSPPKVKNLVRASSIFHRKMMIAEISRSHPGSPDSEFAVARRIASELEKSNTWWVSNNRLFIYSRNASGVNLKHAIFSVSNRECGAPDATSRLLELDYVESFDGFRDFLYIGDLPFNYMKEIGSGLRCGVFVSATQ